MVEEGRLQNGEDRPGYGPAVAGVSSTSTDAPTGPVVGRGVPVTGPRGREASRHERREQYLSAGFRIVVSDGDGALTMQRLADEVGAAVGTMYRYFASKDDLLAQVQAAAIERLTASVESATERLDEALGGAPFPDPALRAAAQLVVVIEWYCEAHFAFTKEIQLLQQLLGEWTRGLDPADSERLLPSVQAQSAVMLQRIVDAEAAGAVKPGNTLARGVIFTSSMAGVLQIDRLGVFGPPDPALVLARATGFEMLRGWGMAPELIDRAKAVVADVAAAAPLAGAAEFDV